MASTPAPDLARLKALLHYDPDTGEFRWVQTRSNVIKAGDKAGLISNEGYARIGLDKVRYFAHRLAWLYMTGEWPAHQIDHINGNRGDNRWCNLRQVTPQQNTWNQRNPKGANPYLGASYVKRMRKWLGYITVHGKRHRLGYYDTPEEAHAAYIRAKEKLHKIELLDVPGNAKFGHDVASNDQIDYTIDQLKA